MTANPSLLPAFAEFAEFSKRAAQAATLLSQFRDTDVDVAISPKEEVLRIGSKTLYHIKSDTPHRIAVPVLVLYAMVGRWTILDLQQDRSFVRNLSEAGLDVYVLDWGHPTRADRFDDLGDMVNLYVNESLEAICARHSIPSINLLGICQGGVVSLCYAALHPQKLRNLITCVTPVDFHADKGAERAEHGFMNVWTRQLDPEDIDLMIEGMGNLPGEVGGAVFSLMTPLRSLMKYNLTLLDAAQDRAKMLNFLRMEKWLGDRPDHTGGVARQWLKDLYQQNKLVRGEFVLGDRLVDLGQISMPVLNLFSRTDNVVPVPCSLALRAYVGSKDYTEVELKGGHIGLFVSRSQSALREQIAGWLQQH